MLSDFEPKGAVAKLYGAYRNQEGVCERALFVLDGAGKIRWNYLSPLGVNPGADGISTRSNTSQRDAPDDLRSTIAHSRLRYRS